jgi:hypothetical protein
MSLFRKHKKFEDQLKEQLGDSEYKPSESLWDRIDSGIAEDGFETGVQQSLENFEQMPYPETWERIAAELPEERVGNNFLKYYGFGLLALLFSTGIYLGYKWNEQPTAIRNTQIVSAAPDNGSVVADNVTNPADAIQSDMKVVAPEQEEANAPVTKAVEPDNSEVRKEPIVASNAILQEKKLPGSEPVVQPENIMKSAIQPAFTSVKAAPSPTKYKSQENKQAINNQPLATIATVSIETDVPANQSTVVSDRGSVNNNKSNGFSSFQTNTPILTPTTAVAPAVTTNTPDGPVNTNNGSDQKAITPQQPAVTGQNQAQPTVTAIPAQTDVRVLTEAKPDSNVNLYQPPVNEEGGLTRVSLSIVSGAALCFTTYKSPSGSSLNFDENIALRKKLERPAIDWSGAFLIDVRLNKRWMVSTGLMMTNFSQKFNYNTIKASSPSDPNEVGAPVTNPGDSVIAGNGHNNRIKYSWTEIPLLINYTIIKGRRINLDLQGGVSYAFINTVDAGIVSYDNKGVLVLKDKKAFPQITNAVFVSFMPQISYQFNETVAIGVMPSFKYSVTSIIGNDRWVQQHPYFIGLNLCLRKRF